MKNKKLRILIECALMVALSTVLSYITIYSLPLGGSVTLASMLPLCVIAYRHGLKIGIPTAFVASGIQLLQGLSNLSYGKTAVAVLAIIFMDYIIAFTAMGFAGIFRNTFSDSSRIKQSISFGLGIFAASFLRFLCHLVSGAVVWYELTKEWAADDPSNLVFRLSAWAYSFVYNISYMGPELLVTLIAGVFLAMLLNLKKDNLIYNK